MTQHISYLNPPDSITTTLVPPPAIATTLVIGQGPAGPGGGGSGSRLEVVQAVAASTWVIAHNLGYRPSVTALSVGGAEMLGEVLHISANVLNIFFDSAVAGRAILV